MKRKLLIATTNKGKFAEIQQFLATMPFELLSLDDLETQIEAPEETEETIEGNAILKARYYGDKTGILTLSEDTGFFIDALDGWPGVRSARTGTTDDNRMETVLTKMKDISTEKRCFTVRIGMVLYEPSEKTLHITTGETRGLIAEKPVDARHQGFGFDPISFIPEKGKTFAEMDIAEKNSVSHRGKALAMMKYHLQKTFSARHIVVPVGVVIQNGKLLMQLRNDPHRPDYHKKWEYPGGGVEFGEQMKDNVVREIKEESGYEVEVVKLLQHIAVEQQTQATFSYQVYLVPYVCKITGGAPSMSDEEVLELRWFDLDEVLNHELIGENARMYAELLPELKETVAAYNL